MKTEKAVAAIKELRSPLARLKQLACDAIVQEDEIGELTCTQCGRVLDSVGNGHTEACLAKAILAEYDSMTVAQVNHVDKDGYHAESFACNVCRRKLARSDSPPDELTGHASNCPANAIATAKDSLTIAQLMEAIRLTKASATFKQSTLVRFKDDYATGRAPVPTHMMKAVIDECHQLITRYGDADPVDKASWQECLAGMVILAAMMADDIGFDFEHELVDSLNALMVESKLDVTVTVAKPS